MGVEFYGILYEDDKVVVAVWLSGSPPDVEAHNGGAEALVKLFEEGPDLVDVLSEEDSVTSYKSVYALTRIAMLVESAVSHVYDRVTFYLAFCKMFGIEPKIVNEYELFPRDGSKKVCILGEGCYD